MLFEEMFEYYYPITKEKPSFQNIKLRESFKEHTHTRNPKKSKRHPLPRRTSKQIIVDRFINKLLEKGVLDIERGEAVLKRIIKVDYGDKRTIKKYCELVIEEWGRRYKIVDDILYDLNKDLLLNRKYLKSNEIKKKLKRDYGVLDSNSKIILEMLHNKYVNEWEEESPEGTLNLPIISNSNPGISFGTEGAPGGGDPHE